MGRDSKPTVVLSLIHKQIFEIKKKIQLSEGQRKAAFEDSESERKSNCDDILNLKKEISQLIIQLNETKRATTTLSSKNKQLQSIIGPIDGKSLDEVYTILDLQKTDRTKSLNLIQYRIKQRQQFLTQLGEEYKVLLSQRAKKDMLMNVDRPVTKSIRELHNSIHAVEVQLREANHVSIRYGDIKKTLQHDSARFESKIKRIEEELTNQRDDISRLQQVVDEATKIRTAVRLYLVREEKAAMSSANHRDKQTAEGKRLVTTRKQELEMLEKRIFQGGKNLMRTQHENGEEDVVAGTDDETAETPTQTEDYLTEACEKLKIATGATSMEEVLNRFMAQRDTRNKLLALRKKYENEKKQLERKLNDLNAKLEQFKYAEVKELERKTLEMEVIQDTIEVEQKRSEEFQNARSNVEKCIKMIANGVQELHFCIDPLTVPQHDVVMVLTKVKQELTNILEKVNSDEELHKDLQINKLADLGLSTEEKWLPVPYSGLTRKSPLPQQGSSPAPPLPPGSEEEEEVPSRAYLKRQAQLVVDAKSRRKNVRMQLIKK